MRASCNKVVLVLSGWCACVHKCLHRAWRLLQLGWASEPALAFGLAGARLGMLCASSVLASFNLSLCGGVCYLGSSVKGITVNLSHAHLRPAAKFLN